jgi:2,4-dienoyl-CoA reductase-like NADH-dependent reductase (Old Yellow Enzyme family)
MFEHLTSPIRIGSMELRNHMTMSAMSVEIADGHTREPIIAYYEERARGEIGDASGPGYLEGAIHDGFRAALDL